MFNHFKLIESNVQKPGLATVEPNVSLAVPTAIDEEAIQEVAPEGSRVMPPSWQGAAWAEILPAVGLVFFFLLHLWFPPAWRL